MNTVIVVNNHNRFPIALPDVETISARDYLTRTGLADQPRLRVINLCTSYRYQRSGYYVSLLAEARGHRPLPGIETIQDLKSAGVVRHATEELGLQIEKSLEQIQHDEFTLSVYFGHNLAVRHEQLAGALFRLFPAPYLRAQFARSPRTGRWSLKNVLPLAISEIPEDHREFALQSLREYLVGRPGAPRKRRQHARYDLAILRDSSDPEPASNDRAIRRFVKAGEAVGFAVEVLGKDDLARVPQFDALFIRDTTSVNHYTYRFARKAKAEGLVVIDEPELILRCMNKVYFTELMLKHRLPIPETVIVDRTNASEVEQTMRFPCVLKQPDSAFSAGVVKAENPAEFRERLDRLLEKSSLVVVQEYRPTTFDWRIGVLDGQPLYACRYFMARRHWQIIERDGVSGKKYEGRWETLPVEQAPTNVVKTAVRAATLYGDSLFGVDLKEDEQGVFVIEVNENPSIDAGVEDLVLKDELYLRIMRYFMSRIEQRKRSGTFA